MFYAASLVGIVERGGIIEAADHVACVFQAADEADAHLLAEAKARKQFPESDGYTGWKWSLVSFSVQRGG